MVTRSQLQRPPEKPNAIRDLGRKALGAWNSRRVRHAESVLAVANPHTISNRPRSERRAVQSALKILGKHNPSSVQNWYQGGFPMLDGSQSWLPSIIQDARYDQNMITRRELLRRMRFWSQNSGICKSTLDVSRQYVVGTHAPVVTSLASDAAWAERAEKVFEEMIKTAGIDGQSLFTMLNVAHDCKKTDGDVLFVETSVRAPFQIRQGTKYATKMMMSVPRLQMVEGHRIETPPRRWNEEGSTIIDGIQFRQDKQTRPDGSVRNTMVRVGCWVKDGATFSPEQDAYSLIPVDDSYLVFSPTRVDQVRGISDYYAGETTLALLEDLLKMEMRAQEVQSNIAMFITNGAGQIVDSKMQSTLGALGLKVSKDGDGKAVVTQKDLENVKQVYKQIWGGEVAVGRTGDTLGMMAPTRPAEATLNLWEYLINVWCAAAKSARILVFPKSAKGQGTEVRAELDKANTGFIGEFNLNWKPLMHRVWNYFIGWAIQNDARLANAPEDWQHIEVSPPRSVLVDHGYDSASMLAELAAGVTNLHFIAQRLGTTGKRLIAMAVQDIYLIKKACLVISGEWTDGQKIHVAPEEVRQSLSEVIKNLAAMKTAQAQTTAAESTANA